MDPKFNFTLPKNLGSSNQGLGTSNRANLPNGINNSIANKVNAVKPVDRTFKSIDGIEWGSFEEAVAHNKKYYNGGQKMNTSKFRK